MQQGYWMFGIVAAVAIVTWVVVKLRFVDKRLIQAAKQAGEIEETARQDAERIKKERLLEAKDEIFQWRVAAEKEIQEQRRKTSELDQRLAEKEQLLRRELRRAERKRRSN